MEIILDYFTSLYHNPRIEPIPDTVVAAIQCLNRKQRGELKVQLFNEAKKMAANAPSLNAIGWLQKTYSNIESNTFRLHKVLFSPGHDIPDALTRLLDAAQNTIDICVFTISDSRLASKLMDAHERGVKVRILSDDQKTYDQGSQVFGLHQAGIPVKIDHSRYHMHHKFGVVDARVAFSGSYNWTYTASSHNQENLIITTNYDIVGQYTIEFDRLWEQMFHI
jgi:mitochondrial cardiolipin hydrolase